MMTFKEGFFYKGFKYGIKSEILYRLPTIKDERSYPMKIVPLIKLSKTAEGYRLCRDKKSVVQIRDMVNKVHWKYPHIKCKECK